MSHKRDLGNFGEKLIAKEYKKKGYKVVDRNVRIQGYKQLGEIDLIVKNKKTLVFVEVKTRTSTGFMPVEETVGFKKQSRLIKSIKAYLLSNSKYDNFNTRIDVALVTPSLDKKSYRANIIEDAIQDLS